MKPIGTLGTVPTITIGGKVITDFTNLKILKGVCSTNAYSSFVESGNSAGASYVVPATKSFRVVAIQLDKATVAALESVAIGYDDSGNGIDNAVAPTNPLYEFGTFGGASLKPYTIAAASSSVGYPVDDYTVPTGKYPLMNTSVSAGTFVTMYGYEE